MGDTYKLRKRLDAFRGLRFEIENVDEKFQRVCNRMYTVGCPDLSGMPKSSSPGNDKLINIISRRDDLLTRLNELKAKQRSEREAITKAIGKLKSEDEKLVMTMRYLEYKNWTVINMKFYGDKEDFTEKERSYMARVYRMRDKALDKLSDILICP
ncbi:MAG: hypothetical protein LUD47_03205 [Clostridia bacterium]|nr:hypothetical protein [Clostridia bacterium]